AAVPAGRPAVAEGRTPRTRPEPVATPLRLIKISTTVGRRDRAVLAILFFTAAHMGVVARLSFKRFRDDATPCGKEMNPIPRDGHGDQWEAVVSIGPMAG